ncbi:probable serine/threonine-protein kinase At1g54610 [Pistacia vera]|uniref:probable serine/threonine-protein kinase At1g54610 n=1 Tax=Pistacia vera TaxID=55513 RepID=UPI00126337F5|nr:probable serine/threonine-protein kinase At1g54610 [Pistacia vera]
MDWIKKVMGCVQAKNSMNSPAKGLNKLKMENGYVGKDMMGHRRSTGQRYNERELGGGRILRPDLPVVPESSGEGKAINSGVKRDLQSGNNEDGEVVDGWPKWLIDNVPREALAGLIPKSAESYDKLDKVGQGTYSNVYKARDRDTGKIVALKKVRFDTSEPESVKFMAREIMILRKLDHPNVVKLEGLATSRMQYSLYLVFDFMQSDLTRVISRPDGRLTEPQVKCYMHQLLSGLQHCHERGILHRDIKGSNLLIDKNGMLKIADFGLANYFSPNQKRPLTSRVVTLWYRAPELLLGTTNYGVGIDLWSAGCLLAEMIAGRPIMPGRTEVEQLHRIFKLCGAPSEDYWKKLKLSTTFRPPPYKPCLFEVFHDFPESSLGLLSTLLALDPAYRGSASSALQNEFFSTSPLACDLSGLPVIYNKDDDSTTAIEHRKNRRSRMKHRSKTHRERRIKDQATELPKPENESNNEEPEEKIVELDVQRHEPSSSTSSTSSSAKQSNQTDTLPFLLSGPTDSRQKMSPGTHDHPNAGKNIKNRPPLPPSRTRSNNYNDNADNKYRLNQVHRSASTREFRKLSHNNNLETLCI